jgi:hypothetical protein
MMGLEVGDIVKVGRLHREYTITDGPYVGYRSGQRCFPDPPVFVRVIEKLDPVCYRVELLEAINYAPFKDEIWTIIEGKYSGPVPNDKADMLD